MLVSFSFAYSSSLSFSFLDNLNVILSVLFFFIVKKGGVRPKKIYWQPLLLVYYPSYIYFFAFVIAILDFFLLITFLSSEICSEVNWFL